MRPYLTFASIPFGTSVSQTRALMAAKGYQFDQTTALHNDKFYGRVSDTRTDIIAFYDDSRKLAKISVNLETDDDDARGMYSRIHDQLVAKYGEPANDYHFFKDPYFDGDGYEDSAIKLGKATFACFWPQPDGTNQVELEITKQLTVDISYEGPGWDAFVDHHRANTAKDL